MLGSGGQGPWGTTGRTTYPNAAAEQLIVVVVDRCRAVQSPQRVPCCGLNEEPVPINDNGYQTQHEQAHTDRYLDEVPAQYVQTPLVGHTVCACVVVVVVGVVCPRPT